jgi:hypothetical protein
MRNLLGRSRPPHNAESPTSASCKFTAKSLIVVKSIPNQWSYMLLMRRVDDLDPWDRPRKRSSVEFCTPDRHGLSERRIPRSVFPSVRPVSPSNNERHYDSTSSDELQSKNHQLPIWRNFVGGDGVPCRGDRPSIHFSQEGHVTIQSSSTFGESYFDESNFRKSSCFNDFQIHALKRTIDHPAWMGTTLLLILVILFGPAIRDIWLPKTADNAVDVVLTIAFVFLAVDIIIHCVVDRSYFSWNVKGHLGSFRFWFDTV